MQSSRQTPIFRSSSMQEVGFLNTVQRIEPPPAATWKRKAATAAGPKQGTESIFTLGSPFEEEEEDRFVDKSYGGFLKDCSFCKRQIFATKEVFMYGYLRAFCSPECRDAQIAIDESFRPRSPPAPITSALAKSVAASKAAESAASAEPWLGGSTAKRRAVHRG